LCDKTWRPNNEQVVHVRVETLDKVDDTVVSFTDEHKLFIQAKENISVSDREWGKLWANVGKQYSSTDFNKEKDRIGLYLGRDTFWDLKELAHVQDK